MIKKVMKIFPIMAERWKADGGAVFGVVPKAMWGRFYEADALNNIPTCSRCLLVDDGERVILFDTGMGDKQSEKFFSFRYFYGDESLEKAFREAGYSFDAVTDIVFTHLHYDHVGGAFRWDETGQNPVAVFPNAQYWCSRRQYDWARNPNPREAAAFIPENQNPIFESGKLNLIEDEGFFTENIYFKMIHGHTDGQIIPIIESGGKKFVFMADFIPTVHHLPLPYVPSYDIRPLTVMEEKEKFLQEALENGYFLVFEHDPFYECCSVHQTQKGVVADEMFCLEKGGWVRVK